MPKDSLFPSSEPVGYDVWHKHGHSYQRVASVQSNALGAMMMTTHGFMGFERWQDNPHVTAMPGEHRSTTIGDVLIHAGQSLEISADNGLSLKPIASIRQAEAVDEPREVPSPGLYQVWHANDREAVHQSRMEHEPYVHGHTHVASVEARDLQHAAELTVETVDRAWRLNPEVKASVVGARDTGAGDVIVDPLGRAYLYEGYRSFREVEAAGLPLLSPGVERAGPAPAQTAGHLRRSSLLPPPGWSAAEHGQQQPGNEQTKDNGQDQGMAL